LDDRSAEAIAMMTTIVRILAGYCLAVLAAAVAFAIEARFIFLDPIPPNDVLAVVAAIGIFAWGGLLFAFWAERVRWTRASTFLAGGILAAIIGIATVLGISIARNILQGSYNPEMRDIALAIETALQLFILGCVPGAIGGLTYWLAAAPRPENPAQA
jgi:hypothetical protein